MPSKKTLFHDHHALLLVSTNVFLQFVLTVFVWLKLSAGGGTSGNYFISYRPSLGIGARQIGSVRDILTFVVAGFVILIIGLVLAQRTYDIKRELSLAVLGLTMPLLIFLLVVTYLLLALH
jgi:hypothetical protein